MNCRVLWLEDDAAEAVAAAAGVLSRGGVVVFPTDTVYGLLAASGSPAAYQRLFEIKGRLSGKPLALLAHRASALVAQAELALSAQAELLDDFRRGTLTVVLPPAALPGLPPSVQQLQPGSVGLRCPAHAALQQLLAAVWGLVWATSLNAAGEPAVADASAAQEWLTGHGGAELAVLARTAMEGRPSRVVRLEQGQATQLR